MTITSSIDASKTAHDENFPVASFLIAPRLRTPILSFYRFARAADDIADRVDASQKTGRTHPVGELRRDGFVRRRKIGAG